MNIWKEVILADVLKEKGYIRGPFGSALKRGDLLSSGIPVYEQQHAIYNVRDFRYHINDVKFEEMKRFQVKENDLIISCSGTVGKVSIIRANDPKGIISQALLLLRVNDKIINPLYLKYFFSSWEGYNALVSRSGGSVQANISRRDVIESIPLKLPPLEIQNRIVGLLAAIDKRIENNTAINQNLLQQIETLYGHFLNSSDWPVATILDVAAKVAMGPFGSNIKVSTFVPEGVPIISGNHLKGYFLEEPEFNYITEDHAERLKNSIVYPRDIVFTHAGNIGQVALIPDNCKFARYVLSQRQFYLRCNEDRVVPEFMLMFFHSALGQHELLSYANQTGVPSIAQPASNLKKIPFKCPPIEEQRRWHEQVKPLVVNYVNNRDENERLSVLRDTLLPRLMSGELDVSGIEL